MKISNLLAGIKNLLKGKSNEADGKLSKEERAGCAPVKSRSNDIFVGSSLRLQDIEVLLNCSDGNICAKASVVLNVIGFVPNNENDECPTIEYDALIDNLSCWVSDSLMGSCKSMDMTNISRSYLIKLGEFSGFIKARTVIISGIRIQWDGAVDLRVDIDKSLITSEGFEKKKVCTVL